MILYGLKLCIFLSASTLNLCVCVCVCVCVRACVRVIETDKSCLLCTLLCRHSI